MRKFGEIYKEKLNESETRQENKVLGDFKLVYNAMLEHYGLTSVKQLDEESQLSFLTELNHYWNEEEGLSEKGQVFLEKRAIALNENSTAVQKKNFLRVKSYAVINETFRQTNLRNRLYDVIDEMYKSLKASDLSDILTPDMITTIISESLSKASNEFLNGINKELKESVKPKRKYFVRVNAVNEREFSGERRDKLAKEGKAMSDGSFPIVTVEDLKNAIKSHGRAKNVAAAKAHIKKRAKALGKSDLIPDNWK
jgi:hypothetical protein